MPVLTRPDGEIHYQTFGSGFPVLLFAPGGLRSRMEMWPAPPGGPPRSWVNWTQALPAIGFTAIVMNSATPASRVPQSKAITAGTPTPPTIWR